MDPHHLTKSTSAVISISKVTGTISATNVATRFTRYEKANTEREVTLNKVSGPTACVVTDRCTQHCLTSSLQGPIQNPAGLVFLPSMYAEMLS